MKQLAIVCMIAISVLSCDVRDLMHTVDQYDVIIRIADVVKAVLDDDMQVDWDALQRLQLRYNVDIVNPTNDFLLAASNYRSALKDLQEAIAQEERTREDLHIQRLEKRLRALSKE